MSMSYTKITSGAPSLTDPNPSTATTKRSISEKVISFIFDGPSGTASKRNERELREKWDEDKRDDIPRTAEEEKQRRARMKKRAEIVGGGDGLRTNDLRKGGFGGAGLGVGHA